MKPPDNLPPLPPNTRYAGRLRDHSGRVAAFIYCTSDPDGWEYSGGWVGMDYAPEDDTADWHVALPIEAVLDPANCPECGEGCPGCTLQPSMPDGHPKQIQCRTCFERDAPATPSAQLFATLDPENGEEVGEPADDHKDCRDGCRYSHDLGDGMQRVCPYGECQRNNPRFPRAEPAKDQPASDPNNLEGNGRTIEEMAAATRELNRIAPTPADKFALMFGRIGHFQLGDHTQINKTETP